MCGQVEVTVAKCRARQLVDASERIIDKARSIANMPISSSLAEVTEKIIDLRRSVAVFDTLNTGMTQSEITRGVKARGDE